MPKSKQRTNTSSARATAEPKYWYVPEEAERPIRFIESKIKFIEGDLTGEYVVLEEWQKELLRTFFGWFKRDKKGRVVRKYRQLYLEIPRKNSKTTLTSWIVTFVLFCEGEQRGQVYAAAADKDQANILFGMVRDIVLGSPDLARRCRIFKKHIEVVATKTIFKGISAEADTKHGYNASCFVVDEVHVQPNRNLIDVLTTGNGTRAQPIEIYITTAGDDLDSICWILHERARMAIEDPDSDPTFLGKIFGATDADDWTDRDVWQKCNPMLGISINWEKLEEDFAKIRSDPGFESTFKRLYLNIWNEAEDPYIPRAEWLKNALDYGEEAFYEQIAYGGLDLSSKIDWTAFALAFNFDLKDGTDRRGLALLRWLWRPLLTLSQAEKRDQKPYEEWLKPRPNFPKGLFETTPGRRVNMPFVADRIIDISKRFRIKLIGFDSWNADFMATKLEEEIEGLQMVEYRQGMKTMTGPTKEFHAMALDGTLINQKGDRMLEWMIGQCKVERDKNDNWQLTKAHGKARIDGVVASIIATGVALADNETSLDEHIKNNGGIFF